MKSEDCGRSGWMVDGWPISEASSAAMRDSAAARLTVDGSVSISGGLLGAVTDRTSKRALMWRMKSLHGRESKDSLIRTMLAPD